MLTGVGGGAAGGVAAVVVVPALVFGAGGTGCALFPLAVEGNGGAVGGVTSEGAI